MKDIILSMDYSPLWISIKTGLAAAVLCFFLGVFAAAKLMRVPGKVRGIIDSILLLPMVLPPTAAGFILLLIFSRRRPVGAYLYQEFHLSVVQSWAGCVLAAVIIAFPLMYQHAKSAFEQVDVDLIRAAQTLGMSDFKIFWRVVMPAAKSGIGSGLVLTFARALGEYGATSMIAGNIAGKTGTISQKIAMVIQNGDFAVAGVWALIVTAIALIIMIPVSLLVRRRVRWRR